MIRWIITKHKYNDYKYFTALSYFFFFTLDESKPTGNLIDGLIKQYGCSYT